MRTPALILTCVAAFTTLLPAAEPPATLPGKLFVTTAPAKPATVGEVASAPVGIPVIVRGTVAADGFVAESAVFAIAGEKTGDKATVRVTDKAGKPLAAEIKGRRGLYPGAEVVVSGRRAMGDGLVIDATSICVTTAALPEGMYATGTAPADAKWVEEARASAKKGESIVLRGYIGGSVTPFIDDRAIVTLMGNGLRSCADMGEDHCKTPWDYCCETAQDIAAHSATIQVVDPTGQILRAGLKRGGVKELAEVIVVGTVAAADKKVFLINATALYAVPKQAAPAPK
jgi:hypothetical protein